LGFGWRCGLVFVEELAAVGPSVALALAKALPPQFFNFGRGHKFTSNLPSIETSIVPR